MILNHILSKNGFYWLFYYLILLLKVDRLLPDRSFLELQFRCLVGKKLDLKDPKTFNEKLQWLKLYDRRPEYTTMVDKYAVKKYVADKIGEEFVIPTLGVWNKVEDIDWDDLPDQFVLKCTHDSGGLVICRDKAKFDIRAATKKLRKSLKRNFYMAGCEWPYKNVPRRIIAEEYMEDKAVSDLPDYKFFCFNGVVKALFIGTERGSGDVKFDYYDSDFNHLDLIQEHPMSGKIHSKPVNFEKMKELASHLSKGLPHVRVDFYNINGKIFFGEMTFFHHGGVVPFHPEKWDYIFGGWLNLPKNNLTYKYV